MTATPKATPREWAGLAVLILPGILVSMDMSVLFLAIPFLVADLAPTSTQMLWILDIYGFLLGGLLIIMGTLGDRIGRRRLLMIGATLFGLASILAAFSPSPEKLIFARALLGIGGATLAPSTLALIRNMFHDEDERRGAIAIWTAGFAGGAALGPVIGGLLLENFFWGSVFLLNVPVMVLLLAGAPLLLPEYRDEAAGRFDILSAVLTLAAILPVIQGIKMLAGGYDLPWALALIALGLLLGWLFVRRQARLADPLIDVSLFRNPRFSASILVNTIAIFAFLGFGLFSAQYFQLVLGLSPFTAALWSLPSFVAMAIGTMTAPGLARRIEPAGVITIGLLIAASGFAVVLPIEAGIGLLLLVTGSMVMAYGLGMVTALATDLIVNAVPLNRAGGASAISETGNEMGGALGIALFGSMGAFVYRLIMVDPRLDAFGPEVAAQARNSLAGAMAALADLPGSEAMIALAQSAFTNGLRISAAIAGLLLLIVALVAVLALRGPKEADGLAAQK